MEFVPNGAPIPLAYTDLESGVPHIHGVNRNGCFADQRNNMRTAKAPFGIGQDCVPLYRLVDAEIRPPGNRRPGTGMQALMSDGEGHILVLESSNGIAAISEKYAVMTNLAVP